MADLWSQTPNRAMAIYAHPDDPDVSCGGTLATWADAGCMVAVVICTDGGKGTTDPSVRPADLADRRRAESERAAAVLGVKERHQLGLPDGELVDDDAFRCRLVELVRAFRPDVVLAPDPTALFFGQAYFNHRDHRVCGLAVLDAVAPAAALPHYFPTAGPPHQVATVLLSGSLEPDVWVDVSNAVDRKGEAVACHASQFTDGGSWAVTSVRLTAEDAGRQAGLTAAEGFRRLDLGG